MDLRQLAHIYILSDENILLLLKIRTATGFNLGKMKEETQLNPQTASSLQIKQVLSEGEFRVPDQDVWRLLYPAKLLDTRHGIELELQDIVSRS